MNRKIKFRGKRVEDGVWVYGYYLFDPETTLMKSVIYSNRKFIKVLPETVGQLTGLHDKNGKEIYEGDILTDNVVNDGIVKWDHLNCRFIVFWDRANNENLIKWLSESIEITGNIHDND